VGVSAQEMAAAGIVLRELGTQWVPLVTRYDEKLKRMDVMEWGIVENKYCISATNDAAELAAAMVMVVQNKKEPNGKSFS